VRTSCRWIYYRSQEYEVGRNELEMKNGEASCGRQEPRRSCVEGQMDGRGGGKETSWRWRRMEKPHEGGKSQEEAVWMDRWMEEVEVKKRAGNGGEWRSLMRESRAQKKLCGWTEGWKRWR